MRIDAIEKNLAILNREVKKVKELEDNDKQIKVDMGIMKRDYDAKQAMLKQSLKPITDKLMELSQDLDTLKGEVKAMKGLKLAPGVAPFKTGPGQNSGAAPGSGKPSSVCVYVRVALQHNRNEVHEFPTDENGNLSFTAVNAVYPGKIFFFSWGA